jgi:uncharacterized protein (TIGR02246 family)
MKYTISLATLPLIALAACNPAQKVADPAAELAAIAAIEQAQMTAFNADDLDAATAPYAEDAIFVGPGEAPSHGMAAIRAGAEAMMQDPNLKLEITHDRGWVAASGDLAVTTANWTLTMTGPDGNAASTSGVNQSTWQKQADGWKMILDFNSATPALAELSE